MSERPDDRHLTAADNGEEVAAYALGALEPREAAAFERHLETCAICRDELAAFRGVVELLPLSVDAVTVPGSLRRRVLREVRGQARAAARADRAAEADRPARSDRPARVPGPAADRAAAWRAVGRPGSGRLGLALAGLAAAVLLAVGGLSGVGGASSRTIQAQVIGAGRASLRIGSGRAELVVAGLPAPPPGRIYEVWLARRHGAPIPTPALFSVTRSGRGDVMVPGDMRGVVLVMVTAEPVGGSRRPTRPPVILARI